MNKLVLQFLLFTFLLPIISVAQNDDTKVWKMVEKMPQFPGGDVELMRYLSTNIKYPHYESENNIQGKVFCGFVIDTNGKVKDIKILRGVANGEGLSAEAIRVIGAMPNWIPGEQNGKKVAVEMMLPINFEVEVKGDGYVPPMFPGGTDSLENLLSYIKDNSLVCDSSFVQICLLINKNGYATKILKSYKKSTRYKALKNEIFASLKEIKFIVAHNNGLPIDANLCFDIYFSNEAIICLPTTGKDDNRRVGKCAYIEAVKCAEQMNFKKAIRLYHYSYKAYGTSYYEKDLCFNLGSAYFNIGDTASACESWLVAAQNGDKEAALLILKNNPKLAAQKGITNTNQFVSNDTIIFFGSVLIMPQFPGGERAFLTYIEKNFVYPAYEREYGITGKVFVSFVVKPDGFVSDVKVLRGVAGGKGLDKEAVRVTESSPTWIPGKKNGEVVPVYYRMPISCYLK